MKRVVDFVKKFKAGWDAAIRKSPPPRRTTVRTVRFFLTGKNSTSLWRGISIKGNDKTHMEQWVKNPFTKKMEWAGSYLGEWEMDKANGEPKEISMMAAEAKFPGSIKALMIRESRAK